MPRPNFEKVPLLKKPKDPYIIGAADSDSDSAHKEDFNYDPTSSRKHYKMLIACDKMELSIYVKLEKILSKTGVVP